MRTPQDWLKSEPYESKPLSEKNKKIHKKLLTKPQEYDIIKKKIAKGETIKPKSKR